MKCWKCGSEIPDDVSICPYCSISMTRRKPMTDAGRAMRQIYDHFGSGKVFDEKSILPVALGDLLQDSKELRHQVEKTMAAGIGNIYLNQLRDTGRHDALFTTRVKKMIVEDAGFSEEIADNLMSFFDEMIGWEVKVSTDNSTTDCSQPTPRTEIPLPTAPIPKHIVGCGGVIKELFFFIMGCICITGGITLFTTGVIPIAIFAILLGVFLFKRGKSYETYPGEKKITRKKTASTIELSWKGELDKFAIAVGDQWVLTGRGTTASLKKDLFAKYNSRQRIDITMVEITASGVELRGTTSFYP